MYSLYTEHNWVKYFHSYRYKTFYNTLLRFIGKLLVVTELCQGGNLQKFLRNSRVDYANVTSNLNQRQLLKMAVEVASGMVHLSSQKVFTHRFTI